MVNKLYIQILYYIELQDYNIFKTYPKKNRNTGEPVSFHNQAIAYAVLYTGETLIWINYKFNFFFGTFIDFFLEIESLARSPRFSPTLLFWLD